MSNNDTFNIQFTEGYIVTLVKTVGAKEAKKRLFEEGSVAFKMEIERVVTEITNTQ